MNDTMIERMVVRLLALSLFAAPLAGQTAKGTLPGGFEVGDQILLEVEGDTQFTHAFSVGPGPALTLPVIGEVEHPGFYTVLSGAVVSDALMAAGGPTKDANFTGARIERDGKGLYVGNGFQDAFTRGLTVEGMGLRTGDRIIVPRRNDTERTFRILGILVSIPVAIIGIAALSH